MLHGLNKDCIYSICLFLDKAKTVSTLRQTCKSLHNKIPRELAESKASLVDLIKIGNLKALQLKDLPVDNISEKYCALSNACGNGHLAVAQWLTEHFGLTVTDASANNNYALAWACGNGHLAVAQWLTEHFGLTIESNPFSSSLGSERTKGNEHNRKDATANCNEALRLATISGHLEVA